MMIPDELWRGLGVLVGSILTIVGPILFSQRKHARRQADDHATVAAKIDLLTARVDFVGERLTAHIDDHEGARKRRRVA